MRGGCCPVAVNITVWTIYIWKHFFGAVCLWLKSLLDCLLGCLLVEDLSCDQITPVCYGRWGDDIIVSCEDKILVGVSILPLICWQGPEDDKKAVSAEIPEPVAANPRRADSTTSDSSCHSKESWLDHFGLINKFVQPLQSQSSSSSSPWTSLSTEQQHLTTHHYWRSTTELWTSLDPWWWQSPSCIL